MGPTRGQPMELRSQDLLHIVVHLHNRSNASSLSADKRTREIMETWDYVLWGRASRSTACELDNWEREHKLCGGKYGARSTSSCSTLTECVDTFGVFPHTRVSLCAPTTPSTSSNHSPNRYRILLPCDAWIVPSLLHTELDATFRDGRAL